MLDRFEDYRELLVVFVFERFDLSGEGAVCVHEPPQLHECAHDGDVDLNRAGAAQDTRKHGDALLSESVGEVAPSPAAFL